MNETLDGALASSQNTPSKNTSPPMPPLDDEATQDEAPQPEPMRPARGQPADSHLPNDPEAEKALLGGIMLDPQTFERIAGIIGQGDFYDTARAAVFRAMGELRKQGKSIEPILLCDELGRTGDLDRVGGASGLMSLTGAATTSIHNEHYARIIQGHSVRRQVIALGEAAYDTSRPLDEAEVERVFAGITASSCGRRSNGWRITSANDIEYRPPVWLWEGWLRKGTLNMLAGRGKTGKSFMHCDIAARITRGDATPDGKGSFEAGRVLFIIGEAGGHGDIRYRFENAGGILDSAYFLTAPDGEGKPDFLLGNADRLASECQGYALVVIDSVNSFTGAKLDTHRANEVYAALASLENLARKTGCAILLIHHENKSGRAGPDAVQGSVSWNDYCRATVQLLEHHEEKTRRLVYVTQSNDEQLSVGLSFHFIDSPRTKLLWDQNPVSADYYESAASLRDARDRRAHEGTPPPERGRPDKSKDAADGLKALLASGPKPAAEIMGEMAAKKFSKRLVESVKADLSIESFWEGRASMWKLPNPSGQPCKKSDEEDF